MVDEVRQTIEACTDFDATNGSCIRQSAPQGGGQMTVFAQGIRKIKSDSACGYEDCKRKIARTCAARKQVDALKSVFSKYDKNNDGLLDKNEIQAFCKDEHSFVIDVNSVDDMLEVMGNA